MMEKVMSTYAVYARPNQGLGVRFYQSGHPVPVTSWLHVQLCTVLRLDDLVGWKEVL